MTFDGGSSRNVQEATNQILVLNCVFHVTIGHTERGFAGLGRLAGFAGLRQRSGGAGAELCNASCVLRPAFCHVCSCQEVSGEGEVKAKVQALATGKLRRIPAWCLGPVLTAGSQATSSQQVRGSSLCLLHFTTWPKLQKFHAVGFQDQAAGRSVVRIAIGMLFVPESPSSETVPRSKI